MEPEADRRGVGVARRTQAPQPSDRVRGSFRDPSGVEGAVAELLEAEFAPSAIHVVVNQRSERDERQLAYRSSDLPASVIGGMAGAVLGAITGLLFHFRVFDTAFLEAFFDGGLFWTLFRGVVGGALFGGLLGGVAGFGWWRQAAPTASGAQSHVVTVDARGRASEARRILDSRGARPI